MRSLTRLSTAACTLAIYLSYLLSEPKRSSCVGLAESFGISHDSVNRFLQRENYTSQDLFHEVKGTIDMEGGRSVSMILFSTSRIQRFAPLSITFGPGNISESC